MQKVTSTANRFWQPPCSHGTYQHEGITSRSRQLLMMGTWLPETCWATVRREIKNTESDIYSVFLIHTELRCTVNHTSDTEVVCITENYDKMITDGASQRNQKTVFTDVLTALKRSSLKIRSIEPNQLHTHFPVLRNRGYIAILIAQLSLWKIPSCRKFTTPALPTLIFRCLRTLNKYRPTLCHLLYYFTIYCSKCFEC